MEDFVEIIFYVVILVLSGIGSLLKNRNKQEKAMSAPKSDVELHPVNDLDDVVVEIEKSREAEDSELARMLREVAAQQRSKEALDKQQREVELRQRERERRQRNAELLSFEQAKESAKKQQKVQNNNFDIDEEEATLPFALNFSEAREVRRAFISSEILNRKY